MSRFFSRRFNFTWLFSRRFNFTWLFFEQLYFAAFIVLAIMFLTGCATPKPKIQIKQVEIPVQVPCQVPDVALPIYRWKPPYTSLFVGAQTLLGDREVALAYEELLRVSFKACK